MEWPSFVIAALSLGVTGLSLYLSYRERISGYRDQIYGKQVDVLLEIVSEMEHLDKSLLMSFHLVDDKPTGDIGDNPKMKRLHDHLRKLMRTLTMYQFVLPNAVSNQLVELSSAYFKAVDNLHRAIELGSSDSSHECAEPQQLLKTATERVDSRRQCFYETARKHFGIDSLDQQTQILLRQHAQKSEYAGY